MADSEFCEGRQKNFAQKGSDLIFRWEWYFGWAMGGPRRPATPTGKLTISSHV